MMRWVGLTCNPSRGVAGEVATGPDGAAWSVPSAAMLNGSIVLPRFGVGLVGMAKLSPNTNLPSGEMRVCAGESPRGNVTVELAMGDRDPSSFTLNPV